MLSIIGCGRSSFEGLLQRNLVFVLVFCVVEGPVLRDYYNTTSATMLFDAVVEGPISRDYYNIFVDYRNCVIVVQGPILRDYYNIHGE